MRSRLRLLLLLTLSISVHALPAEAQRRRDRSDELRGQRNRETVEAVVRSDRERAENARTWSARRGVPTRLRQRDGRLIQLIDAQGIRPVYVTSHNAKGALLTGTHYLHPGQRAGLSLTGMGLRIGIWDGGHALLGHQEFGGRASATERLSPDDHATHVAGTMAGGGVKEEAMGMAFRAQIASFDWEADVREMQAEAARGLLLSNHSYGEIAGWHYGDLEDTGEDTWYWLGDSRLSPTEDYAFGLYGEYAELYDGVTTAYPYYLPVVAAGNDRGEGSRTGSYRTLDASGDFQTVNPAGRPPFDGGADGFDTISGAANAKNVLTVGSIGVTELNAPRISSFSGFGPTDDGRIKPDLVSYGERVYSSVSSGPSDYRLMSGTSMATPNVSGSLLLLQEHHRNVHGRFLSAAALKGLALHTARDLASPGPDYRTGWGLLDAETAARVATESAAGSSLVLEDTLYDGDTSSRLVRVTGAGPVRITLSWTDPMATRQSAKLDDPTPRLLNDLDVRLVNQGTGAVYLPYRLDPANPSLAAVPGDNTLDPLEQVHVNAPAAGVYAIVVTHKRGLSRGIAQPFALIATGVTQADLPVLVGQVGAEPEADRVSLSWSTLFERQGGTFRIERVAVSVSGRSRTRISDPVRVGTLEAGAAPEGAGYTFVDRRVLAGEYLYQVYYDAPDVSYLVTEVLAEVRAPERMDVLYSYPNPFSSTATLVVDLPASREVILEVFDVLGRRVALLLDEQLAAGRHEVPVDGTGWPPGVYFARLTAGGRAETHRMVLAR